MTTKTPLLPIVRKYFEKDPLIAAHALETISSEEAVDVLKNLPPSLTAEAFRHINDAYAAILLQKLPQSVFRKVVNNLGDQQAANIFIQISNDLRKQFLELLDDNKKRKVQELLTYPEDSAGRIMTLNFIAFHSDIKVKDAIQKIRLLAQKEVTPSYIYVIDQENRFVGVMNMRDILLAQNDVTLESVMRKEIFSVNCFDDKENIAHKLTQRKYFAVPVVDHDNRLLGVVRADKLISEVKEETTQDIQKMFGASGDERTFSPLSLSIKTRLPWLHVNLATAFLAASVVALFEDIIAKMTVLAVFLPVVAGQGGNAGAQSLAVVMRGLVMREIPKQKIKEVVVKETILGIVNGVVIGLVTGLIAWMWKGNPFLGIVIGLGMLVNLIVAGFSGALIPILMKAMRLDPAQCSSIILTTITDVIGFMAFLGFAVVFQNYLI